jgi:transcription initiation factor TFIIIB Brf1 subunit/transcription initiation factor TFIIB
MNEPIFTKMNCPRSDHRRALDFSAVRSPEHALANAIFSVLQRRKNPMTEREIAKWFRATPSSFVRTILDAMVHRGEIESRATSLRRRGVLEYTPMNRAEKETI